MTIVQIVRAPAGGIRKHVVDLCQYFVSQGHRVVLVTDLSGADHSFKKTVQEDWFKEIKLINLAIPRSPHPRDLINLLQLAQILFRIKPDVVHGHGAKGGIYARLLGGRRSVYSPHGGSLHGNYGAFQNFVYQSIEKLLLPLTGWVLLESQYTFNKFRSLVSQTFQRVSVNYNGIVFPAAKPIKSDLQYRVAALGLLRELKGFDLLVRAAAELKAEYPKLKIKISGEGEERKALTDLIKGLHVSEIVELAGEVEDPKATYNWTDLVVVPSRFESFGLVALEAMSEGVPVIAAQTGGLVELIRPGETGRLFTVGDSQDLVRALREAFQNWGLMKTMAANAFEIAKSQYTHQHMLLGVQKTYQHLLEKQK